MSKICPECEQPVIRRHSPLSRTGWALSVSRERLMWMHHDGEPLCPEVTARGYQPALPIDR